MNDELPKTQKFKIDTRAPTASGTVSATGAVQLTYSETDPTPGSGVTGIHTIVGGAGGSPITGFTSGASGTITLPTTCSAVEFWGEDVAGNLQSPHVVKADSRPPVFTSVPGTIRTTSCTTAAGFVLGTATATDDCSGAVLVTNDAPAKFSLGKTVVTWKAKDAAGNVATATQAVFASLGDDPSCCPAGTRIIMGTSGPDILIGTAANECIIGLGWPDHIEGRGGRDYISGGDGDDTLIGGSGPDSIWGGAGIDGIDGQGGDDYIDGGGGLFDVCSGGLGWNSLTNCEVPTFCTNACCVTNSCDGAPTPPPPTACEPAYQQLSCPLYTVGAAVSASGHNWDCNGPNCVWCAGIPGCAPGASGCPFGTVWTDRGICH